MPLAVNARLDRRGADREPGDRRPVTHTSTPGAEKYALPAASANCRPSERNRSATGVLT
ncbi:MAG: hypothetical protein ACRDT4_15215 [Micromonosporaceae bacterium]